MDVEVERAGHQERPVGPQHTPHFLEAAPEARHVLEGAHGDDGAEGGVGEGQFLHVGDLIDAGAGAGVDAEVFLAAEERPQVGDVFLPGHLIRADFQDGFGQVKGLGDGAGDSVQDPVHAVASSSGERR